MIALVLVRFVAVGFAVMGLALFPNDAQAVCGDGAIDGVEDCDLGVANGMPGFCCSAVCVFETAATGCRPDAGECDVTDFCTGSSDTCPTDGFEVAGTACGSASDTICDDPDACDGSGGCESNFELATVECRADAGACDVAELCDGAGSCPTDGFEVAGTACGSASDTICDDPDACDGSGGCESNFELATVECRADAGACDVAELCDGAGSCPTDGFEVAGTACGSASDTICDDPDACDGSGGCESNFELATVECRADAGACDVAELCDGAGSCPTDGFEVAGTACGSASDTICDDPDACDGSGGCESNFELATVACRADAGACDVAELCDGAGSCPTDGFEVAGTACGSASDTICDDPDACDGSGGCESNFELATVACRADAGACDVAELCDGAGSCPTDGFEVAGTACGSASDTICDDPDACDGSGGCESNFELATVECRADAGACDVAELCDGAGSCPTDGFEVAGTACGSASDTICDDPDACDGSGSCESNFELATVECRADAGACDVAELCDGAGSCPTDGFEVAGTACGSASDTICDDPDACDGSGGCESNFELATVECRADAGACDVAELCDGAGSCPTDGFEVAGTACGSASDTICDDPDACDGSGGCDPNFELATVECRPEVGDCDVAELCDGAGGGCPADEIAALGVSCRPAGGPCDLEEACPGDDPECPIDAFRPDIYSCRPPVGTCDLAELCSGSDASCPADVLAAAGTTCRGQSGACDMAEECNGTDGACPANYTIVIDFDDSAASAGFSQGVPLTDQYADFGVVWQGTGALVAGTALNGLSNHSAPNFVAYSENQVMGSGGASDNIDTMDLECTAEAVTFFVGAESQGAFGASAFDSNGIPLDQSVIQMDTALQVVTLEAGEGARIARIDYVGAGLTELDAKPRFAIDDVVLLIPEPARGLIGLTSLAMLVVLSRRARFRER